MKNCETFAALLDLYVDGELSPEEMAAVQDHLGGCQHCRAYVDEALQIRAAFPDAEDTPVPDGFAQGIMAEIRRNPQAKKSRATPWKKVFLPMAACFALIFLALPLRQAASRADGVPETAPAESAAETPQTAAGTEAGQAAPSSGEASAAQKNQTLTGTLTTQGRSSAEESPAEAPTAYAAVPDGLAGEDLGLPQLAAPAQTPAAVLTLTAEQAGSLLAEYTPFAETAEQTEYHLPLEAFTALQCTLAATGNLPDAANEAADEAAEQTDPETPAPGPDSATSFALVIVTK